MAKKKCIKYFNCDWSQSECTNVLLRFNFQLPTSFRGDQWISKLRAKVVLLEFQFPGFNKRTGCAWPHTALSPLNAVDTCATASLFFYIPIMLE